MSELVHEIKLGSVPGGSGIARAVDVGQVNSAWLSLRVGLRKLCCLDREIRVGEILITSREVLKELVKSSNSSSTVSSLSFKSINSCSLKYISFSINFELGIVKR